MGYFRQLFLEYLYLKISLLAIAYLGRKYNLNILHFDVRKENCYRSLPDQMRSKVLNLN